MVASIQWILLPLPLRSLLVLPLRKVLTRPNLSSWQHGCNWTCGNALNALCTVSIKVMWLARLPQQGTVGFWKKPTAPNSIALMEFAYLNLCLSSVEWCWFFPNVYIMYLFTKLECHCVPLWPGAISRQYQELKPECCHFAWGTNHEGGSHHTRRVHGHLGRLNTGKAEGDRWASFSTAGHVWKSCYDALKANLSSTFMYIL